MKLRRSGICLPARRICSPLTCQSTVTFKQVRYFKYTYTHLRQTQEVQTIVPGWQGALNTDFHQRSGFSASFAMEPGDHGFEDFEDESDSQLKAAIAASLRDINGVPSGISSSARDSQVVDLTADSDNEENDEDLKAAIELSLSGQKSASEDITTKSDSASTGPLSQTPLGILGLDRKKMEEERLARLAKRKAEQVSQSPPSVSRQKRHQIGLPEPSLASFTFSSASTTSTRASKPKPLASSCPGIQYPQGIVKKTWVFGVPRSGDDIKIEEVLQQTDLELTIASSFMWDLEWFLSKTNTASTRYLLMMQAKEEATRRQYEAESASFKNIRLCFPPMDGQVNCMHSKLMILFHKDYARVVIPSANLVPFDWGESGGVMENIAFLIDLPKLQSTSKSSEASEPQTKFHDELNYFLRASTVHENLISKLSEFDFSETAKYAFVHTIGGSHTGEAWKRTGYCGLGRAVASLGLRTTAPVRIDFVASSVGSLTEDFLRSLYLAAKGDDGRTEHSLRTQKVPPTKARSEVGAVMPESIHAEWKTRFRVYFPCLETVGSSKGGTSAAGTICLTSRWWDGPKFPRHVFRDCISRRNGILMHNKMLFVRPDEPVSLSGGSTSNGWAYVGSANLSESAWGRLVQDRTLKAPKLNCRNWECGVLIPIIRKEHTDGDALPNSPDSTSTSSTITSETSPEDLDIATIFKETVPVPMRVPAPKYGDNMRPWFYAENL